MMVPVNIAVQRTQSNPFEEAPLSVLAFTSKVTPSHIMLE